MDNNNSKLFAHSTNNSDMSGWQQLGEHLDGVACLAESFALSFNSGNWAWNAGCLHDLGKATNAFQSYLLRSNGMDDSEYDADGSISNHASTGAACAIATKGPLAGKVLAYICAGHHAGLPDWHTDTTGNAALSYRLEEGKRNLNTISDYNDLIVARLKETPRPPEFVNQKSFHFWMRMLFSCLVDADFLDTERFMDQSKAQMRSKYPELSGLAKNFWNYMDAMERRVKATTVNIIRKEIREACESAAKNDQGLFSLSVPTGGGKTLSALAFAFRHLQYHQLNAFRRIIYVIPYTSIIEQTARTLANIFGRENVVEHHSNLSPEKETPRSRLAAENWDAPIIVTTNVQFFESFYAAKSSRCRKLHNVVNSTVIFDEAQLLPPEWLTPCVEIINQLVLNYGVTVLLATATQPALPGLLPATEIIPTRLDLYKRLRRTNINLPQSTTPPENWDVIARELKGHDQVLCIVNTRRDCYDLYKAMPEGTLHLSALMCGRHRSAMIRLIKLRLRKGLPLWVISTQLVEAGVDIDFPVVYRALAGLDSIAQAAGRCDREGSLTASGKMGQVHVFIPPKPAPPGLLRKGEDRMREIMNMTDLDLQDPVTFRRYFTMFYGALNSTGEEWLDERFVKNVNPRLEFQFRTGGREFQIIKNYGQAVFVSYGKSSKWLDQLRAIGPTRENMRALQRYAVNLSKAGFDRARASGLVENLWQDEFWGWLPEYDRKLGVDIFGGGWSADDLII